jgi:hypothetical protein
VRTSYEAKIDFSGVDGESRFCDGLEPKQKMGNGGGEWIDGMLVAKGDPATGAIDGSTLARMTAFSQGLRDREGGSSGTISERGRNVNARKEIGTTSEARRGEGGGNRFGSRSELRGG